MKFHTLDTVVTTVLATMMVLVVAWAIYATGQISVPTVARCPEDSVLVGAGEYDSGWWDSYECGPALDDFGG